MKPVSATGHLPGRHALRAAAILSVSMLIAGCTVLPDWADPGGWFEKPVEPPSRISAAQDTEAAQAGDFPNLASVPDKPREATSQSQRTEIAQGLAADRSNAEYTGQRLVGDESVTTAPAGEMKSAPAQPAIAGSLGTAAAPAAPAKAPVLTPPPAKTAQMPAKSTEMPAAPAVGRAQVAAAPPATQTPPALAGRGELAGIIYFAHGSITLHGNDMGVLRGIAALHRQRGGMVRVIGHASARTATVDPVEHRLANLEVSQQRADAVARALTRMGVPRDKLVVEARADTQPIYHEFMPTGEAGNRRAEIFLEY